MILITRTFVLLRQKFTFKLPIVYDYLEARTAGSLATMAASISRER